MPPLNRDEPETLYGYDIYGNVIDTRIYGEREDTHHIGETQSNVLLSHTQTDYDEINRATTQRVAWYDYDGTLITEKDYNQNGVISSYTVYADNSSVVASYGDNATNGILPNTGHHTEYDTCGRTKKKYQYINGEIGSDTENFYNSNGQLEKTVSHETSSDDEDSSVDTFTTSYTYDSLGRVSKIEVGDENYLDQVAITKFGFDSSGQRIVMIDPEDNVTHHDYDAFGRLTSTTQLMPEAGVSDIVISRAYDDNSRLVSQTDSNGNTTHYAYDLFNRQVVTLMADFTLVNDIVTNGTMSMAGSGTVTWSSDGNGGLVADLTSFVSGFNAEGQLITSTDANGTVITRSYDPLGRETERTITPGSGVSIDTTTESRGYNGLSQLIRVSDNDSKVERDYDSLGGLRLERAWIGDTTGSADGELTKEYDVKGRPEKLVYPSFLDEYVQRSYHDELGLLDSVELNNDTAQTNIDILKLTEYMGGRKVLQRLGNLVYTHYTYDGMDGVENPTNDHGFRRLIEVKHIHYHYYPGNTIIDHRTYTWDKAGNKTSRTVHLADRRWDYTYDSAGRLTDSDLYQVSHLWP